MKEIRIKNRYNSKQVLRVNLKWMENLGYPKNDLGKMCDSYSFFTDFELIAENENFDTYLATFL